MSAYNIWLVILGGSILTIIPRVLPIIIVSKLHLSERASKFLKYVPITLLTVLVFSELFINNNKFQLNITELLADIITIIVAIKKDNLLFTVLVGIVSEALLRLIIK